MAVRPSTMYDVILDTLIGTSDQVSCPVDFAWFSCLVQSCFKSQKSSINPKKDDGPTRLNYPALPFRLEADGIRPTVDGTVKTLACDISGK